MKKLVFFAMTLVATMFVACNGVTKSNESIDSCNVDSVDVCDSCDSCVCDTMCCE